MERHFTKEEGKLRQKFHRKMTDLTNELNQTIGEAIRSGVTPDVHISMMATTGQPVVRVEVFRRGDTIS